MSKNKETESKKSSSQSGFDLLQTQLMSKNDQLLTTMHEIIIAQQETPAIAGSIMVEIQLIGQVFISC